MNLYEVVKTWPTDGSQEHGIWSVAPSDTSFCKEGTRLRVGFGTTIGADSRLGDYVALGRWVSIGHSVRVEHRVSIGSRTTIGDFSYVGEDTSIGSSTEIGSNVRMLGDTLIGSGVTIGNRTLIRTEVDLPDYCSLGGNLMILHKASDPIDLGFIDGYRQMVCHVRGVAHVDSGGFVGTLSHVRRQLAAKSTPMPRTEMVLRLAELIAKEKGWKED